MNDPFFAGIMFQIESVIFTADCTAGIELKDSYIKSSLNKAKHIAQGKPPKSIPKNDRDRFILQLAQDINVVRSDIRESDNPNSIFEDGACISTAEWILAIKAVEGSLKNHTESGTRCYLDFLKGFMARAGNVGVNSSRGHNKKWWQRIFKPK